MEFKITKKNIIPILVVLILFGLFLFKTYNMRGWEKEPIPQCAGWSQYSNEDLNNGIYCVYKEKIFEECTLIETDLNTEVRACTCLRNNETILSYCDKRVMIYNYDKGYKASEEDVKNAENLLEEKYNVSLSELGIKGAYNIGGD